MLDCHGFLPTWDMTMCWAQRYTYTRPLSYCRSQVIDLRAAFSLEE